MNIDELALKVASSLEWDLDSTEKEDMQSFAHALIAEYEKAAGREPVAKYPFMLDAERSKYVLREMAYQDKAAELEAQNAALLVAIEAKDKALTAERDLRILGQSPECGNIHWESIRDMRREVYGQTEYALVLSPCSELLEARDRKRDAKLLREVRFLTMQKGQPITYLADARESGEWKPEIGD